MPVSPKPDGMDLSIRWLGGFASARHGLLHRPHEAAGVRSSVDVDVPGKTPRHVRPGIRSGTDPRRGRMPDRTDPD